MVYLDTSVVLAQLLAEDVLPPKALWSETVVTSRLSEYELWVRLNARGLARTHGDQARQLLGRIAMLELVPQLLARALDPFPSPLRTLDALHLASVHFLREHGQSVQVASFDGRLRSAAATLRLELYEGL